MNDWNWQQQQQMDEEALQKAALEALAASTTRPLTEDEAMTAGYLGGIANALYKELHK